MAGADAGMIASLLYRDGPTQLSVLREQVTAWLEEHEYFAIQSFRTDGLGRIIE
jgi:hypothetical protein